MQIYIPTPIVVDNTFQFQARIPHDGCWILIKKPFGGQLTLRYGTTDEASVVISHDKYYYDADDDIHHAVFTLPNHQRVSIIWIPRPMRYHHIHIQAPRLLVQFASTSDTRHEPVQLRTGSTHAVPIHIEEEAL